MIRQQTTGIPGAGISRRQGSYFFPAPADFQFFAGNLAGNY
jgi:hypothetical protein